MPDKSLEAGVLEWLGKQGYPLELRTAATFRQAGFSTFVSYFYNQQESGKPREIDVVSWSNKDICAVELRISFIVECKASASYPWVCFRGLFDKAHSGDSAHSLRVEFAFGSAISSASNSQET